MITRYYIIVDGKELLEKLVEENNIDTLFNLLVNGKN